MSYIITQLGGTSIGCSLIFNPVTAAPSGYVFGYDLSATGGNGMLNLVMFG